MSNDIKLVNEKQKFKYRLAAIIIQDNKLLTTTIEGINFINLPGGYTMLGETTKEAILREMKEESCLRKKQEQ